ncbi:hypothetical protein Tco_1123626, partial [Tanacetum coccineum]
TMLDLDVSLLFLEQFIGVGVWRLPPQPNRMRTLSMGFVLRLLDLRRNLCSIRKIETGHSPNVSRLLPTESIVSSTSLFVSGLPSLVMKWAELFEGGYSYQIVSGQDVS